jgi:hypothetical protein
MTIESRDSYLEPKDPDNIKTYAINLVDKLPKKPTAVTLAGAVAVGSSNPAGLTIGAVATSGTYITISTSGGTLEVDYEVTVRATYSDGQTRDITITIPCRKG